jgi:hypothetical protein
VTDLSIIAEWHDLEADLIDNRNAKQKPIVRTCSPCQACKTRSITSRDCFCSACHREAAKRLRGEK